MFLRATKSYYVTKSRKLKRARLSESSLSSITDPSESDTVNKKSVIQNENEGDLSLEVRNDRMEKETNVGSCNENALSISTTETISSISTTSSSRISYSTEANGNKSSNSNLNIQILDQVHNDIPLKKQLQLWCINNIFTLRNVAITDLLQILRNQGYTDLPKHAKTLLKTNNESNDIKIISTAKGHNGLYTYFGIEKVLSKMIETSEYDESFFKILVNIDGMNIYKSSNKQFWPILIKIYHEDFESQPAAVALYCGDSKPHSVKDFLSDFVNEATHLINNGVTIFGKQYSLEILGFVCDTPARSFIKCVKGHGGFYACERCEIKGSTLNKRRIYAKIDCKLRTKESFFQKTQEEHHHENVTSPLVQLPNFDPVRQVFLDSMHLFHLGVMKTIFGKFINTNSNYRLSPKQKGELEVILKNISPGITVEFQRRTLSLQDYNHWKATQFRMILSYLLPFIFKKFISTNKYKHLLLLFVAVRLLFDTENATKYPDYPTALLKQFFLLMPAMYGNDSQIMNFHNLIHVEDDVKLMKTSLSSYSAYPFENYLGIIRKLIRTPNNPLAQVSRRLNEMQSTSTNTIKRKQKISDVITKNATFLKQSEIDTSNCDLLEVKFNSFTIRSVHPDNVISLKDGQVIIINKLFSEGNNLFLEGCSLQIESAFDYPCDSKIVGVFKVIGKPRKPRIYSYTEISKKCIKLKIGSKCYVMELLHL